jgi:tight adherence protein C
MLTLICASAACSTVTLSLLLCSRLTRRGNNVAGGEHRSRWQWLLRWCLAPIARWLAPCISARWRAAAAVALERANVARLYTVEEWLAMQCLAAGASGVACLMLANAAPIDLMLRAAVAALAGFAAPWVWLRDRIAKQQGAVLRALPGYLDLLTLGLESGCAFGAALQIAVRRSPASPLRAALECALQEMRSGQPRAEALRRLERRLGVAALSAAVAAIVQAEATGISLAPVMRAQALRGTQERFARAEKLAMEAPVKMLAPLALCIFPCTFIVLGFPIAVRLLWGL